MAESNLAKELGQKKPFPSLAAEAAVSLSRTSDVVHRFMATVLDGHDITRQQYNVLRGYDGVDPCAAVPPGHNPEMWRKHNGCE